MYNRMPAPPIISPWCPEAGLFSLQGFGGINSAAMGATAASTWAVANLAFLYPFRLYDFATIYRLFFQVGTTAAGNVDVGIYTAGKKLIVSAGSTVMAAANSLQEWDIADTELQPGEYLLAAACSSASATGMRITGLFDETTLPSYLVYEQASALPLPATCSPVLITQSVVSAPIWLFGAVTVPLF